MGQPKVGVVNSFLLLAAASATLLVVFITSGLAGSPNATKYGFKNSTAVISNLFYTQVTPANYTFSIWGVIYLWQILWIGYAWTFACRPNATKTISASVYSTYIIVNCLNIAWIYTWGNELVVPAAVILFLFDIVIYTAIGLLTAHFNAVKVDAGKLDTILTYLFPLNGLCLYATWTTIAALINLTAAVQTTTSISDANMATISLTILLVLLLVYFFLDMTILDGFGSRYVYSVYPVVVWALTGELVAHWGKNGYSRNNFYTLILLVLAVLLLVAKFIMSAVRSAASRSKVKNVTV